MDGGKLAMKSMAEGLKNAGIEVHQFLLGTPGHPIPADIPKNYPFYVHTENLDTSVRIGGALFNLLGSRASYNLARFRSEQIAENLLLRIKAEKYDIVQAESIFALELIYPILDKIKCPVVLRAHNVEHKIWERLAHNVTNPLKKIYLTKMSRRLKLEEIQRIRSVSAVVAISSSDLELFYQMGLNVPAEVIGIAQPLPRRENLNKLNETQKLFHIGAMDWQPNQEAIDWFLKDVWPVVHQKFPEITFSFAGKSMPNRYKKLSIDGVKLMEAPDAYAFMRDNGLMVVPLLSGGGIRVKIIEGLSLGKVILTTSCGVEGIDAEHGKHLFICNQPADFVEVIQRLRDNPELINEVSENAINFARNNFDPETLTNRLIGFYKTLIST
jgi:glycosyltransferase involved in cell wall biosynthesis